MRGGIGLVAGYIGGYVLSSIMGPPAPATTTSLIPPSLLPAAPASTSLLPAGLVSMLPFIGAIGGAYIGARKPEC